ncbi:aspartyl protease family protein [Pseudomonas sp. BGr12]|uniref:aspartyl protease family protein n=1 Tax=Pseudomonas sp. BGr12 TaxID=2936269 RepID=UPI00255A0779|nr:aspartyl protease family protein [Pseudomonas sp. BJa5]MDL2426705.1 aspartyl protease family protein [Pseudomonas sp. BJa5]
MPSINVAIGPQGPVVELYVGVSSARLTAIRNAGLPDPPLQTVRLLIDTGASGTNICSSVMSRFGMQPTGTVQVFTPSTGATPVSMDQYDVNLYFTFSQASQPVHMIPTVPITCADFQAQGIHGLLGRDILNRAGFVYHGDLSLCVLNF